MVQINWTYNAIQDLNSIYEYISQDSKTYAKRQVLKIRFRTQEIKQHLKIGRIVPEFKQQNLREIIEGRYRIVYKIISPEIVDILTIHHSSRNIIRIK